MAPHVQSHFPRSADATENGDAVVIGTGQAGPFLAQRVAGAGMKVAIIERKLFGGTCVKHGLHTQEDYGRKQRMRPTWFIAKPISE